VDDAMYVMEAGGHKVAPAPTSTRLKKVVDHNKSMSQHNRQQQHPHQQHQQQQQHHQQHQHHQHRHHHEGERGGGTHIAATVKNTVRRLLRRTKSHRDAPSANVSTMTSTVANGGHAVLPMPARPRHDVTTRNDGCTAAPPPSDVPFAGRYSRARVRLQVRERSRKGRGRISQSLAPLARALPLSSSTDFEILLRDGENARARA